MGNYRVRYIEEIIPMWSEVIIGLLVLVILTYLYQYKDKFSRMYYDGFSQIGPTYPAIPGQMTVILSYTDWCHYCKVMKPVWAAVKANALQTAPDIIFIENNEQINPSPDVNAYPTIDKIIDGKKTRYTGGADYQTLYRWVMSVEGEIIPYFDDGTR